jgi:hypothetical protein
MHGWSIFDTWTNHSHTWTHTIHHSPNLEETTTLPLIVFSVMSHRGYIKFSFCLGTPNLGVAKFSKLEFPTFWKTISSCANLWLKWGLKKICSQVLSNNMLHAASMHVFQGDYWFLMVMSQIDTLTIGLSFGYNLCFKYSNGSYEPILKIYVSKNFQWSKKLFNSMNFDLCNTSMKIGDSNSQSWNSLGSGQVHSLTLLYTLENMKCDF